MIQYSTQEKIPTETFNLCPACNSEGVEHAKERKDQVCELPGSWSFYQCKSCKSLWLNPRPTSAVIPSLYTEKYHFTHGEPVSPLVQPSNFFKRLKWELKLGIWQETFGYRISTQPNRLSLGILAGRLLSYWPGQSKRAGYPLRFLKNIEAPGNLLEVGSGNGQFLWLMKELGWNVHGIEPDPRAVEASEKRGIPTLNSNVETADLKPSFYDAIVMHHVIEHLYAPKEVLQKLVNSLKPGGLLISISPNPVSLSSRLFPESWYGLADTPRHLMIPSPQGYREMLEFMEVNVDLSSTTQITFWLFRESISIFRTGRVGKYKGWALPKFLTMIETLLLVINPFVGEEVICFATKK